MAPQAKLKFYVWFDYYAYYFSDLAKQCQSDIDGYHNNIAACSQVIDCIVEKTAESVKSNMQSASITLGLMPVILPPLAPSMGDMALLAQSWPAFFVVASLATPAANVTSLLAANDAMDMSRGKSAMLKWMRGSLETRVKRWSGWLFSFKLLTYLLTLAAVANLVEVSYRTDVRTASGFRCGQNMMPLIWAELSIACYSLAAYAVHWNIWVAGLKQDRIADGEDIIVNMGNQAGSSQAIVPSWLEAVPEALWVLGGLAAVLQLVFGIIVFSSLIFISAVDAILVFLRYAASCAVCRLMVAVALALAQLEKDVNEAVLSAATSDSEQPSIMSTTSRARNHVHGYMRRTWTVNLERQSSL